MEYDLQKHLISMEERINLRFDKLDEDIEKVADKTGDLEVGHAELAGRVSNLEEKAGWIKGGIAAALIGTFTGLIPHIKYLLTGK